MRNSLFTCVCLLGIVSNLHSQADQKARSPEAKVITPLVFAQEFHTGWRTPRYVSGWPAVGSAFPQPWDRWGSVTNAVANPEEIVAGTWRRNTLSQGYPLIGTYDSRNFEVLRWQIRLAKSSGLAGLFVDMYYGAHSTGDFDPEYLTIFPRLLDISQQENFKIAIEDEAYSGNDQVRDLGKMTNRVITILQKYKDHPAYLKIDGQPVYHLNFFGRLQGKWTYADLSTFMTNVETAVGNVYWIILDNGNSNDLAISKLDAIQNAPFIPTNSGIINWTQANADAQTLVSNLHAVQKKAVQWVFYGFNDAKLNYGPPPEYPRYVHRDSGNTLRKQLNLASQTGADFVVISSFNDWQENSALEPGSDFEDYAGDPYQYLKIIASYTGATFTPPPLPSKDSLDPLIWGKLFGIDKAGPVPSQITFDSDTSFSTILTEDMSNVAGGEYFLDGWHSIRFNTTNAENGLHLLSQGDGVSSVVNRAGRNARSIIGSNYFYIDDIGVTPGDYEAYVAVEYFDNGTNFFGVEYNSTTSTYDRAPVHTKENSGTWKVHVFHLDHAAFAGKENGGADFRLFDFADSLIIARISVMIAGKGIAMIAQDGAFNSLSEKVNHSIAAVNDGDAHAIYVHGKDAAGNWGPAWSSLLTTLPPMVSAPAAPTLASPTDGLSGVSILPTLNWNATNGATSYRLQLSTSSSFSTLQLDDSTITTTSCPVGPLVNGTTYYWRLRAKNYKGSGSWSPTRSFVTVTLAPPAPTLVSPADGAKSVPTSTTLIWGGATGAATYHLQLSTASSFLTTILNDSTLTTTSRTSGILSPATTYYWRTRAKNASGTSAWSTVRGFTTVALAPLPPILAAPVDSAQNTPLNTTLNWNAALGATSYDVQLSTSSAFASTIMDDSSVTTTSRAIVGLSLATRYYWRVRGKNNGGYGAFSPVRQFSTIRTTGVEKIGGEIPTEYGLAQNYPNPFNPSTTISYQLPKAGLVSLKVYNTLGVEVATLASEFHSAGFYQVQWTPQLPSGVYLYRLQAGQFTETKKLLLLK